MQAGLVEAEGCVEGARRGLECHTQTIPAVDRDDQEAEVRHFFLGQLVMDRIVDVLGNTQGIEMGQGFGPLRPGWFSRDGWLDPKTWNT